MRSIRVVLSHWHDDHVAGNEAFFDCEIIALDRTEQALAAHRAELESGDPPIQPLVMPNRVISATDRTEGSASSRSGWSRRRSTAMTG